MEKFIVLLKYHSLDNTEALEDHGDWFKRLELYLLRWFAFFCNQKLIIKEYQYFD